MLSWSHLLLQSWRSLVFLLCVSTVVQLWNCITYHRGQFPQLSHSKPWLLAWMTWVSERLCFWRKVQSMQATSIPPQILKATSKMRLICARRWWQDLSRRAVRPRRSLWEFYLSVSLNGARAVWLHTKMIAGEQELKCMWLFSKQREVDGSNEVGVVDSEKESCCTMGGLSILLWYYQTCFNLICRSLPT